MRDQQALRLPQLPEGFVREIVVDRLGSMAPQVDYKTIDANTLYCKLTFPLAVNVRQDDWQLRLIPEFQPEFHWAPHLAPTDSHIMDQHIFRSPALIVQDQERTLTLIPDLALLTEGTPVRWYMDLDAQRNILTLGMSECQVTEHVLFERAQGAVYPASSIKIGFYIMMYKDERITANPWRPVLDFLWHKWGGPQFRQGNPKIGPLENYVQHTYKWAFEHWQDTVWQEFEWNGRTIGAPVFIVDVSQSPSYPGIPSERESRAIWNQAWFSSLRSAQGLYRYGQINGEEDLVRRALLSKELALSAPQINGIFPAVIGTDMEQVEVEGQLVNRSKGWDECFWGNSNRNPVDPWGSIKAAPYHVLDMSWTALLMLGWYEELERDERLLAYTRSYAEALLAMQDEKGFFPAWLIPDTLKPIQALSQSPETSLSVTFLLKLYEMVPNSEYLAAALKAMDIVLMDIVPIGKWEDFETYWSCCSYGRAEWLDRKVTRNNMYKQCNFSIYWTAEALFKCYQATENENYLSAGERCLDEMLMTQASWQPPYIYVEALGGFGVMNCDGEWNDARQSLFAELILLYGMELDRLEYIERGVAALRASFVMMYCPENPNTKQQWEKAYPFFTEKDYGFMMENYGHDGSVSSEGKGMGKFTIFDWGNGAASEAYLRIKVRHSEELLKRYNVVL